MTIVEWLDGKFVTASKSQLNPGIFPWIYFSLSQYNINMGGILISCVSEVIKH